MSEVFEELVNLETEISALKEQNMELRDLLIECVDDLEGWIDNAYPKNEMHYPTQKRRYKRDMDLVYRARKYLGMEDDRK